MHNTMEHGGNIQEQRPGECAECLKPFGHIRCIQGRVLLGIWTVSLTGFFGGKLQCVVEDCYVVPSKIQLIENMHVMRVLLLTSVMPVRLAGE